VPGSGQNAFNCDYNQLPPPGQVCNVDIKNWAPCTQENNYNYHKSAPCIFLKLNKIYGWIPEYYNDTTRLPWNMPDSLKTEIGKQAKETPNTVSEKKTRPIKIHDIFFVVCS
jgi:sodium/potassium-transporting ATPase subunit beta